MDTPNPAITYLETARDNLANNIGVALREGRTGDAATMALDHFCIGEAIDQLRK